MDSIQQHAEEISNRRAFLYKVFKMLSFNEIEGDYVEFGSHSATTFRLAYTESRGLRYNCHMWSFDAFSGLPTTSDPRDLHPRWTPGTMSTTLDEFQRIVSRFRIKKDAYSVVPGLYSKTLADSKAPNLPTDISFAYVDCDLYSSTADVLRFLATRLKHGMVIALDDYFCYSKDRPSGERAAFVEFCEAATEFQFLPYAQFNWSGMSFICEASSATRNGKR